MNRIVRLIVIALLLINTTGCISLVTGSMRGAANVIEREIESHPLCAKADGACTDIIVGMGKLAWSLAKSASGGIFGVLKTTIDHIKE